MVGKVDRCYRNKMKYITIMIITIAALFGYYHPLNAQNMEKKAEQIGVFPRGEKLPEQFSKYFIGQAYLAPLTINKELNCPVSNVTFEPACRNNWHSHTGGQLLIAISGRGYYQERGKVARELLPGDVVEIAPNVEHWHGAAPDSWFSHLAIETNPQINNNTWFEAVDNVQYAAATAKTASTSRLSDAAVKNHAQWFPNYVSKLKHTDPEFIEVFDNFAFDEVLRQGELDTKTRIMVTLASTIAQNTLGEYKMLLYAALANGVSPIEIKEIVYQSVAYCGVARIVDFLSVTNDFLIANGIALPLESQSTTTPENRFEKGLTVQYDIFGKEFIDPMFTNATKGQEHIPHYLADNCFGDYQTRSGLDKKIRELLTFSILVSLGGCEPQVKGHIAGNMNVGNNKTILVATVTQLLPYIGYPRTLNALRCINDVIP